MQQIRYKLQTRHFGHLQSCSESFLTRLLGP